ncbi:hypothetical protein DM01DRAFT_1338294 [Hesseltinella vesiculosa]|uniref:Uncharacterized protein n=1 Tax=Hesseltinella vesiculosa TaxID=101127 RepID=A0A1X2GAE5_9FUNG|nr:hypothetical protein DM01DRAFT_1338294 [Hesseltinella vesiculosa]
MAHVESAHQETFSPSLGLRWWMNRIRRNKKQIPNQQDNGLDSDNTYLKHADSSIDYDDQHLNVIRIGQQTDTVSYVSVSDKTSLQSGQAGTLQHDMASSLRVLYPSCASSENSSRISEDIKSNASIKSKPWVSQPVTTISPDPAQSDDLPSPQSADDSTPAQRLVKLKVTLSLASGEKKNHGRSHAFSFS